MTLQFPKVHTDSLNKVFVSFYINKVRDTGFIMVKRSIHSTDPNSYPIEQRLSIAKVLAAEVYSLPLNGGVLLPIDPTNVILVSSQIWIISNKHWTQN